MILTGPSWITTLYSIVSIKWGGLPIVAVERFNKGIKDFIKGGVSQKYIDINNFYSSIINDIRIWVYNLWNSFVTKKIEGAITISVKQNSGKKTVVKFAWRNLFYRNLINGGFLIRKGERRSDKNLKN